MTGRDSDSLDALLSGLADGLLSAEEEARLAGMLRADAAARRRYRHFMTLHASLMWDYAAAALPAERTAPGSVASERSGSWGVIAAIAATIVLVLAAAALWLPNRDLRPGEIVTLDVATGAVSWTGGGTQRTGLAAGAQLAEGTLLVESDGGSAQLRFRDGTTLTLAGEAELGFSDAGQKRLSLRRGALTAQVQPQPAGRPLLIRTATAELEVLGTEFTLAAEPRQTAVSVEKGNVRLRRLADGQTVEITDKQAAVASLEGKGELRSATTGAPPAQWRRSFETALSGSSKGEWLPATETLPGRVRAVPLVAGRSEESVPVIHYGIALRSGAVAGRLVTLSAQSTIKARARTERRSQLKLFVSCLRGGSFAGNFEVMLQPGQPDQDGWSTWTASLQHARAVLPERHPQIQEAQVVLLMLHTIENDAGLEIAELAIEPAAGAPL